MSLVNAFVEGGPFMFVILAFALFAMSFLIERGLALFKKFKEPPQDFRSQTLNYLSRAEFANAENYALKTGTSLGNIIAAGLRARRSGGGEEQIQARMDEQLSRELDNLDRRTGFLAMFGNVATLVGLLGTITGMIHSFAAVATASPMDRATMLSKGISEAMNCTAFGLIVAVPALVAYAVYQNKTDRLVNDMTNSTAEIYHDIIFVNGSAASRKAEMSASRAHEATQDLSV